MYLPSSDSLVTQTEISSKLNVKTNDVKRFLHNYNIVLQNLNGSSSFVHANNDHHKGAKNLRHNNNNDCPIPNKQFDDLFLITTHQPGAQHLKNIVQTNWHLLGRTNTTDNLHQKRIIFGRRINENIRDMLNYRKHIPRAPHPTPLTLVLARIADTV